MLVEGTGAVRGSLTGGCVEGAVVVACEEALETGASAVHRFGYSDSDAFAVGLMCGGTIDVLVQSLPSGLAPRPRGETGAGADGVSAMIARLPGSTPGRLPGIAAVSDSHEAAVAAALTPLVPADVLDTATRLTLAMIRRGDTGLLRLAAAQGAGHAPGTGQADGSAAPVELFVESHRPPAHLVVCGANAFGQALVAAARPLGHRLTVCDPRPAFADPASFPGAEVVRAWPHHFLAGAAEAGDIDSRSMVCVLTHDPTVDVPALTLPPGLDVATSAPWARGAATAIGTPRSGTQGSTRTPWPGCTRRSDWGWVPSRPLRSPSRSSPCGSAGATSRRSAATTPHCTRRGADQGRNRARSCGSSMSAPSSRSEQSTTRSRSRRAVSTSLAPTSSCAAAAASPVQRASRSTGCPRCSRPSRSRCAAAVNPPGRCAPMTRSISGA